MPMPRLSRPAWARCCWFSPISHNPGAFDWVGVELQHMCVQDGKVNPKAQDHVTFRTCLNPKAIKAAEKVGGVAAQYAGQPMKPTRHLQETHASQNTYVL